MDHCVSTSGPDNSGTRPTRELLASSKDSTDDDHFFEGSWLCSLL